jgi:purine-binding chemotaxis protein CheW
MSESPSRKSADEVLEERARALAEKVEKTDDSEVFATVAEIAVGKIRFGLPVEYLVRVVERTAVTPLPGLPPWISGIAQVRGVLMSVVHLGRWLGVGGKDEGPFFAVLHHPQGPLAVEVDAVAGVRAVKASEVASDSEAFAFRVPGIVRAATKDLLLILNPAELLGSGDLIVDTGGAEAETLGSRQEEA